jgi:hypothetical protein
LHIDHLAVAFGGILLSIDSLQNIHTLLLPELPTSQTI